MDKKVLIISEGEPRDSKTWSNIPYFLVSTLEQADYSVETVDVSPNRYLRYFFDHFLIRIIRLFDGKNSEYKLNRTKMYEKACKKRIQRKIDVNGPFDICISTSFSFGPCKSENYRTVLLCDWTFKYHIEHYLKRFPSRLERKAILRQNRIIENADLVISLFPDIAVEMQKSFSNVKYLGNVINIERKYDTKNLHDKFLSNSIVFIGGKRYVSGAKALIRALECMQMKGVSVVLDIIGLTHEDFDFDIPQNVHLYGYLRKSDSTEIEKYYSIIRKAKVCVNTTPVWTGFSSIIEAMYLYTPVIVSYNESFNRTFGDRLSNKQYCDNMPEHIEEKIADLFSMSENEYLGICEDMRAVVDMFTWPKFVSRLEEELNGK